MDCPICGDTDCERVSSPNGGEIFVAEESQFDSIEYFDDVEMYRCRDNGIHVFYVSTATRERNF